MSRLGQFALLPSPALGSDVAPLTPLLGPVDAPRTPLCSLTPAVPAAGVNAPLDVPLVPPDAVAVAVAVDVEDASDVAVPPPPAVLVDVGPPAVWLASGVPVSVGPAVPV